jgi:hypothetical protein
MKTLLYKANLLGVLFATLITSISFISLLKGVSIPSGDSIANLESSRVQAISFEHSFGHFELDSTGNASLAIKEVNTIWPPSASFSVAVLQQLGMSSHGSIFLFILFFTFTSTYFSWLFNFRITKSSKTATILTLVFVSLWGFRYWIATPFMPEGIFITMTMLSALYIFSLFKSEQNVPFYKFIFAGLLLSTTYYIKSAAPAFIAAGGLAVLFFRGTMLQKFTKLFWLSIGVLAGALPWLFRNISYGTIGSAGFGARSNALVESIVEFIRLFIPYHGPYTAQKYVLLLAAIFLILILFVLILIREKLLVRKTFINFSKHHFLFIFSSLYIITFLGVMFAAMYILPLASHIEMRYWLELAPFLIPWAWYIFNHGSKYISYQKQKLVQKCLFALFVLIVGANIFESIKNEQKNWVYLPKDEEKKKMQLTIHKILGNQRNIRFLSTPGYRFETKSGLTTAWLKKGDTIPADGTYCFADYKEDWSKSMNYVPNNETFPVGWIKVGSVDEFDLYMPPK